ncbi:NADH dehydrogenase [ubiquinone] 1 beta subcomplex subunit 2 [Gossypium raimondii]|nr:NADH dehydrogenase [ubiquinone] 1 beta subcomplex subunit 2 [Gossypium raimondii]
MGTRPSVGQIRIQLFRIGLNLSDRQVINPFLVFRVWLRGEMGGGHGGSTTYKGLTLHHPKRWHVVTGKGLCAVMWFWVLYRAKQDGPVVLGWRHPWEGHDGHSHGHGDKH